MSCEVVPTAPGATRWAVIRAWALSSLHFSGMYPPNLYLLPVLLLLNHLVAVGELACAISINSLGLFSHGSHLVFNGIILTGLLTSVLVNWEEHKRYRLEYIGLVARTNLVVGMVFFCNAVAVGYLSLRNVAVPPALRDESLVWLVPVPALLLNLLGVYIIMCGHEGEGEPRPVERRTAEYVRQHLMANALGSVATIASTICVYVLNSAVADTLCSGLVVVLMFVCSALLIMEALEMLQVAWPLPGLVLVHRSKERIECTRLSNTLTF